MGMHPHIGSVGNYINVRFSQPGRLAGTQHTEKQYPGPESPLTYGVTHDPLGGETEGLFDRCRRTHTCPNIVHTMSDIEYWEASGAGDTTDPAGRRDIHIPTLEARLRVISFTLGDPGDLVRQAHAVVARGMLQITAVAQAVQAAERGVDVIIAQGGGSGGYCGEISTMALVPQVVDAVSPIPVVASGGIFDGRGIAAAR